MGEAGWLQIRVAIVGIDGPYAVFHTEQSDNFERQCREIGAALRHERSKSQQVGNRLSDEPIVWFYVARISLFTEVTTG